MTIKRILTYLLYLGMEVLIFWVILLLLISGNPFYIVGGAVGAILNIVLLTSLTIREILYWAARKDKMDGWEDDLTNQA